MTPEEYLRAKEQENKRFFGSEMLNIGEAYKALKMAREEMKNKAIMAHRECCECYNRYGGTCDDHDDSEWNTLCVNHNCEYIKDFVNKLNKQ